MKGAKDARVEVVNVAATCKLPFNVRLKTLATTLPERVKLNPRYPRHRCAYVGAKGMRAYWQPTCTTHWITSTDGWIQMKPKKMLSTMRDESLYPRGRRGFVDPVRRLWYEASRYGTLPITSYCMKCRGISKPVNSPFCAECYVSIFELKEISEMPKQFLSLMLRKKMDERRLDPQVRDFVEKNLSTFIDQVIEDREPAGYAHSQSCNQASENLLILKS